MAWWVQAFPSAPAGIMDGEMMKPIEPPARLAFVGLGVMGHAMAANLLRAGFSLSVHSRTRKELAGADWAASAAEAARGAACIGLCVPDTPDVERVIFGAGGIAEGAAPGSVVIDFSTISAGATQGFAERLAAQGVTLLDSPVSGGPQGAIDATLTCMVGGAEAAFAATRAVFAAVGKTITRLGGPGAGQVCKAANQLMIAGTMHAVFEALVMGQKAGLDPRVMRDALLGGSAQSAVLANHALRWMDGRFTPGFRAELMLKDLRLAAETLAGQGVYSPVAAATRATMEAVCAGDDAKRDVVVLGETIARRSEG